MDIPLSPSRLESTLFIEKELPLLISESKKVLDVGCGKLYFFDLLSELRFKGDYAGLDVEPKKSVKKTDFKKQIIKKDFLNFKSTKKYDLIACLWVLEHIKEDHKALELIYNLLEKNGSVILAVPSTYSWPFEFGRHGYRYYSFGQTKNSLQKMGFKIKNSYRAGGLFGFTFMIFYNWIRYLVLIPAVIIYFALKVLLITELNWQKFSHGVVSNTVYFYHKFPIGVSLHNKLINLIVKIDKITKLLPASYIFILKK